MKQTLKEAMAASRPLILPGVQDALTARIVEDLGFTAYGIGGLGMVAHRYALPDVGIVSFGEMAQGVRDIMLGSRLPVLVDADEGYGDVKNVARTVQTYEAMGVSAIALEDQRSPKRCGHMKGKVVVPLEEARAKIAVAVDARENPDFLIQARIDSRAVHGFEDAIHRAEVLAEAGADVLHVEAPQTREEVEAIATRLQHTGVPLAINMSTLGVTPYVPPDELGEMGYSIVISPGALLMGAMIGITERAKLVKAGRLDEAEKGGNLRRLQELMGVGKWQEIDEQFGGYDK
ncbi:MAG: isocitrate lyase/PEP mutase family protein [Gammaproteobacteria bacterium]